MPLTDPQLVVRSFFDPAGREYAVTPSSITDERGIPVTHLAVYAFGEHLLTELFLKFGYGFIYVIDKPSTEPMMTPSGPFAYHHILTITPVCIDKWSGADVLRSATSKILNAASQEIRKVIRENMTGSLRLTGRETGEVHRLGSMILWGRGINVSYLQPVSSY